MKFLMTCCLALQLAFIQTSFSQIDITIARGHDGPILFAGFSRDGKLVVTTSEDATAKIWDVAAGKLIRTLAGHGKAVRCADFSNDGKWLVTGSDDKSIIVWDIFTGKTLGKKEVPDEIVSAVFSRDGKHILIASGNTVGLIDVSTFEIGKWWQIESQLFSASFNPDGRTVLTTSGDDVLRLWNATNGKFISSFKNGGHYAGFSPEGKQIVSASGDSIKVWNAFEKNASKPVNEWRIGESEVFSVSFNQTGTRMLIALANKRVEVRDARTGQLVCVAKDDYGASYSGDGNHILTISGKMWDSNLQRVITEFALPPNENIRNINFSPSNDKIYVLMENGVEKSGFIDASREVFHRSLENKDTLLSRYDSLLQIYKVESRYNSETNTTVTNGDHLYNVVFSPDGSSLVASSSGSTFIWGKGSHKLVKLNHRSAFHNFHPDGHFFGYKSGNRVTFRDLKGDTTSLLVDVNSLSPYRLLAVGGNSSGIEMVISSISNSGAMNLNTSEAIVFGESTSLAEFSLDGNRVAISYENRNVLSVWDIATKKVLWTSPEYSQRFRSVHFSPDGKRLIGESFGNIKIWDLLSNTLLKDFAIEGTLRDVSSDWARIASLSGNTAIIYDLTGGNEVGRWTKIGEEDWIVQHPSGLFDATPGGMRKLYFVQGMDLIQFDQLKDRYYEPGLWSKIASGEKLRSVIGFKSIDLPPDITVGQVDPKGFIPIELRNRGGGIGKVSIFLEGKEIVEDAREVNTDPNSTILKINYYLGNHHKNLHKGENLIAVKAWNKGNWAVSRGKLVSYKVDEQGSYRPTIHIVTSGISDYAGGSDMDLNYAAKDAEDMSKALKLGAEKLFGKDHINLYNLSTGLPKDNWPTKVNILNAFERVALNAHPGDVIVVYLSGHGINVGGTDGDWYYLAQDAFSTNPSAYSDPAIIENTAISSHALVELFKKVPATKGVLIIDACASGKVVDNLAARRDIPSNTLRALDRMKDRTGMNIITGCTADAVSYEASKYGQGILTYSLLEGMRGASLREGQFVDINQLFQYATERVPILAAGVGGIQTPMIFSPDGSQSFDIGQLEEMERKEIPIAKIRPVYTQSNFQDDDDMSDVIGLGKRVDQALTESAKSGINAPLIFVPVRDYPDGCQLFGRYKKENGKIVLKLRRRCEGKDVTIDISGNDTTDLTNQIINTVSK